VSTIGATNENMTCHIRLDGTGQRAGVDDDTGMNLSYVRNPYSVFVSFHFPKEQTGIVELQEVSFSANGSVIRKVQVNQKEAFDNLTEFRKGGVPQVKEEDESRASFLIKQVDVPHSKLKVSVQAVISIDGKEVLKTWEFELVPITEEELRNNLRDSIMSV